MLRKSTALLLLAAVTPSVWADDPSLPLPSGPTIGLSPIPDASPAPLSTTPQVISSPVQSYTPQSLPSQSYPSGSPSYSYDSAPLTSDAVGSYSSGSIYSSAPLHSGDAYVGQPAPLHSAPIMSSPAAGCACQGGTSYSAGSLAVPTAAAWGGDVYGHAGGGYEALGYAGGAGGYTGAFAAGRHVQHPYYSYRRPWYANGPMSHNVSIAW